MSNQIVDPGRDCQRCDRLVAFRQTHRQLNPDFFNAPVPTWYPVPENGGSDSVRMLIIGLAPGLKGANRTGRPFTGDWAGDLLYETLCHFGFAEGSYQANPDDTLSLRGCAITNAVRCVPPQNKPVGAEVNECRAYLVNTLQSLKNLNLLITLGKISHDSTVRALGGRLAALPFAHHALYDVGGYSLLSSYHCSRYNTNTGRLTKEMFHDVFRTAREFVDADLA